MTCIIVRYCTTYWLQAAQVRLESIVLLEDYHPPAYAYADNITDEKKSQEDESDVCEMMLDTVSLSLLLYVHVICRN